MTEKAGITRELELQKHTFEGALANMGLRYWEYDIRTKRLYRSSLVQNEVGYDAYKENVPESYVDEGIIHPDYAQAYLDFYHKIQKGEDAQLLFRSLYGDGHYGWLDIAYKVVFDETGRPVKAVGVGGDVTKKIIEENLVNKIPSGVGIYEVDHGRPVLLFMNDGFYDMMGLKRETRNAYLGITTIEAAHPDDRPKILEAIESAIEGDGRFSLIYRGLRSGSDDYHWTKMDGKLIDEGVNHMSENPIFYVSFVDINEQQKAKQALEESRASMQSAILGAGIIYFEYYPQTDTVGEFLGKDIQHIHVDKKDFWEKWMKNGKIHPEDMPAVKEMIINMKNGQDTGEGQLRYEVGGQYRWYRYHFTSIYNAWRERTKVSCIVQDVTNEKRFEKLYQEEQVYRSEQQETLLLYSCVNLSRQVVENFSFNGKDLIVPELEHEMDFRKRLESVFESFRITDFENWMLSAKHLISQYKDGKNEYQLEFLAMPKESNSYIFIHMDCHLLLHPKTNDIMAFFYCHDDTHKYIDGSVTKTVLEHDIDFAGVIMVNNGCIHFLDNRDHQPHQPPTFDEDYDGMIRLNIKAYAASTNDSEFLFQKLRLDTVLVKLKDRAVYNCEYDLLDAEGNIHHKRMRFAYRDQLKEIIVVTRTDITEAVEQERLQKAELQKALETARQSSRAKTDFLSRMSHDIRTPMNVIMSLTDFALDEVYQPDKVASELGKIKEASQFLLGLLNDVLDMAKIESGNTKLHPEPYNYREFEKSLRTMFEPACQKKHIELNIERQLKTYTILADRMRFNQIFFNLMSNAVKFTPEGGKIDFLVKNIHIEGHRADMELAVRDNGIGMSEAFQKNMFEAFSQEITDYSHDLQGTGLGLTIAYSLVHLMGGRIEVDSYLGKGTTFSVFLNLPICDEDERNIKKDEYGEDSRFLKGKHVLLAEDHPMNAKIIERILGKKGMTVTVAKNGKSAVELFEQSKAGTYDIILMDIRMPVMDGLEASMAIRTSMHPLAKAIPIFALTANAYDEDRQKTKEAGMNEHLTKPINAEKLYEMLVKYLK